MAQPLTEEWMAQLGRDDGAKVADWVVDQLCKAEGPHESRRVAKSAVGRIHELVSEYEQRGVSEDLLKVWRSACVTEIYRRFAAVREKSDRVPEPAPTDRKSETTSS